MRASGRDCRDLVSLTNDADALGIDGDAGSRRKPFGSPDLESVGLTVCRARPDEEERGKGSQCGRTRDSQTGEPTQESPPADLRLS